MEHVEEKKTPDFVENDAAEPTEPTCEKEYPQSEEENRDYVRVSKNAIIMFFIIIGAIGATIGYNKSAITNLNVRLDREVARANAIEEDLYDMIWTISNQVSIIDETLETMQANISVLTNRYAEIADDSNDTLTLLKRLSDQYNIMGQQLRGENHVAGA